MTDSATLSTTQSEEDMGDLLLEVLPPLMTGLLGRGVYSGIGTVVYVFHEDASAEAAGIQVRISTNHAMPD